MGMITRQAVPATNASGANLPTLSPVAGSAPPPQGFYAATVTSYNSTANTAVVTSPYWQGSLTLPNFSGQTLTAGHTVQVLGSGTAADVIVGMQ